MSTALPRDQFPVADRFRYLNHARTAAPPTVVAHALARDASASTMLGSTVDTRRWARTEAVRTTCAGLLGASVEDISFVRNTTDGMSLVANGIEWAAGDQVAVAEREYPLIRAMFASLADRGVEVIPVETADEGWTMAPEQLEQALASAGGAVRMVAVSWVGYARGGRNDLAALAQIAHRHGALLVADLIQGLGVIPADVSAWGVDAAAAGGQKWLLGPEGTGVLFTTPELRGQLRLLTPGWSSLVEDGDRTRLDLAADPSGRRLDGSTTNVGGIGGLGAAADLLAGTGVESIWRHVDQWCDQLVDALGPLGATILSPRDQDRRSSIVAARFDDAEADAIVDRLIPHGVIAAAWHGAVRFSPHGWNDDGDLAATLRALGRVLRR